jgi:hypothetical protein
MLEVNAHIITKDHFLFKYCHGPFWSKDYDKDHERHGKPGKGKGKGKRKLATGKGKGRLGMGNLEKNLFLATGKRFSLCAASTIEWGTVILTSLSFCNSAVVSLLTRNGPMSSRSYMTKSLGMAARLQVILTRAVTFATMAEVMSLFALTSFA